MIGKLAAKVAAVIKATGWVPKDGHNAFHNYNYATESGLLAHIRGPLAEQGIVIIPDVEAMTVASIATKQGQDRLVTLTVRFTVTDGESEFSFRAIGEGQDRGDKAAYKAMTGAEKYAVMKLLLIPTGDDPSPQGASDPEKEDGDEAPKTTRVDAVKAKVAAKVNGGAKVNAPKDHGTRTANLQSRLIALGFKTPSARKIKIAEWIGRPVDDSTSLTADDWTRCDGFLEGLEGVKGGAIVGTSEPEWQINH
jgi:hypothetical protein